MHTLTGIAASMNPVNAQIPVIPQPAPQPLLSHPVIPTPIPQLNPKAKASESQKLIQQLIDSSKAQKTFYSTKLEDSQMDIKFPRFSGKEEKFTSWYNQVLRAIASPKWEVLYDPLSEDIIEGDEAP